MNVKFTKLRRADGVMDNGLKLEFQVSIPIGFVIFTYTQIPLGKI